MSSKGIEDINIYSIVFKKMSNITNNDDNYPTCKLMAPNLPFSMREAESATNVEIYNKFWCNQHTPRLIS